MKKFFIFLILGLCVITGIFLVHFAQSTDTVSENIVQEPVPVEPRYDIQEYVVTDDDTFARIMEDFGFGYNEMLEIIDVASSTYDLTRIRVGQPLRLVKDKQGNMVYLEYEKDKESIVRINLLNGEYDVQEIIIDYDVEIVKQGDSFQILYEKRFRDGADAGTGNILAGKFINEGEEYSAYLFENEEGELAYFSGEGESMVRQFLRAPLEFRRITSGYTYARFDPINGAKTPHLAIDYAAAVGTPIMSVGDGVVRFAGWNNQGYGNFVSIRHNDVYTTEYAHMSGFAKGIKNGVSVTQGQVIGYVGSTGWSTGPHLHYQIKKNGQLVNPLKLELPPGDPIPEEKRVAFEETKTTYNKMF